MHFRHCALGARVYEVSDVSEVSDVVMAMNLLHLRPDIPEQLRRIRGLVRPGGLFISKTPCIGEQGFALRLVIPVLQAIGVAPRVSFVTERSLGADITAAGFAVQETGMYPLKSRSLFVVARRDARATGP